MAEPVPIVVLGPLRARERGLVDRLERLGPLLVVGRAGDASQAVRICRDRAARCALLFVDTAGEVALVRSLMSTAPLPVVVVPRTTSLGLEALAAGAAEALSPDAGLDAIVTSLRLMTSLAVVGRRQERLAARAAPGGRPPVSGAGRPLVLVGTSTGGPMALIALLTALPPDFGAPVVVVQHMPEDYHPTFVEWLGGQVRLVVRVAEPGGQPSAGTVFVAPGGRNLVLGPGGFFVTRPRDPTGPSPSVNALFESAAKLSDFSLCGVVLTGMGQDGARGLLALRDAGGFTLAQDQATSIVFGMPQEALRCGATDLALPPVAIAERIKSWAAGLGGSAR